MAAHDAHGGDGVACHGGCGADHGGMTHEPGGGPSGAEPLSPSAAAACSVCVLISRKGEPGVYPGAAYGGAGAAYVRLVAVVAAGARVGNAARSELRLARTADEAGSFCEVAGSVRLAVGEIGALACDTACCGAGGAAREGARGFWVG